jgi:hypothetical protein
MMTLLRTLPGNLPPPIIDDGGIDRNHKIVDKINLGSTFGQPQMIYFRGEKHSLRVGWRNGRILKNF